MGTNVTIADIARELKITPATVSRALNGHKTISLKTRKSVKRTARRLEYSANGIASSLRSGRTNTIGVLIPGSDINSYCSFVNSILNSAGLEGYKILIFQTNESYRQEINGIETFLKARVDGIIASIAKDTLDYSHFRDVKRKRVPLVLFDRTSTDLGISSVMADNYLGAYKATAHLIEQGYKRIAHICGPQHIGSFSNRLRGYKNALISKNIFIDTDLIFESDLSIKSGMKAVIQFFKSLEPPDALFAVDDFTALGALRQLKKYDIKVPYDFGVMGFGNEFFGPYITPTLSTIDQQPTLVGNEAVKTLLKILNRKSVSNDIQVNVILEALPIYRQSTKRI